MPIIKLIHENIYIKSDSKLNNLNLHMSLNIDTEILLKFTFYFPEFSR